MAEEVVRVLRVDTKNSGKSINDLRKDIKSLRQELEKTTVGTEEFESTLKQLTQAQKSYNEVQQQVRDMSRTNQQEMVRFANFAKNLGKSYSALNAAIGLFSSGNEDVQKAMLKVQRTIQLIQGLEGIAGLVRDIPKVINSFKNWYNALDPIEKRVDRIASGINGINPQKLQAINEANRAAAGAARTTTTATAAVAGQVAPQPVIAAQNEAIGKQNTLIAAQAKEAEKLNIQYDELSESTKKYADLTEELNWAENTDWETKKKILDQMDEEEAKIKNLIKANGAYENQLKMLNDRLAMLRAEAKGYDDLKIQPTPYTEGLKKQIEILETQRKTLIKSQSAWVRFGTAVKGAMASIGATLGIMAGVAAVIAAINAIGNAIKKIVDAATETHKLNKEINELANKNGAKAIVVLKELSYAYAKVGDSAKEKQKFLKDYSDKIKETGLAIDTVVEAEDAFVNNTQKYVAAIMARAKAQATEQKAIELYQKYLDDRNKLENPDLKWWQKALVAAAVPDSREAVAEDFIKKNREANQKAIEDLDKDIEERLKKMFDSVAEFEKEYAGLFASLESTTTTTTNPDTTDWGAEYSKALEALIKYTKERLGILQDARTKELEAAKASYDAGLKLIEENYQNGLKAARGNAEQILAVEEAKKNALKTLEVTYEREIADIIKKYRDQALEDAKAEGRKQIEVIQQQIEQIRRMNDTSNLRAPRQQNVETQYNQSAITTMLGLGAGWTNTFQSAEDIKAQYDQQVKYNNDLYMLTYERITKENELLNQQLQNEQLTADERFNIERTLVENQIALDDALNENYEANNEAFISMQQKRQQALNATLQVGSNLFGAMATMAKTESQNQKKTEKERQNALVAYKAFAVTQAIINTFQGANEAYTAMASIPYVGPALGIAAAVAAVAMGIANVHSILSESTNTSSATSAATTSAPQAMQTPPIEYTRQLIGDSELDEVNQPIRCYVLESDITTTQNKVAVTESNASF